MLPYCQGHRELNIKLDVASASPMQVSVLYLQQEGHFSHWLQLATAEQAPYHCAEVNDSLSEVTSAVCSGTRGGCAPKTSKPGMPLEGCTALSWLPCWLAGRGSGFLPRAELGWDCIKHPDLKRLQVPRSKLDLCGFGCSFAVQ